MNGGEHGNTWAGYQLRTEELAEGSGICSGGGHHAGVWGSCVTAIFSVIDNILMEPFSVPRCPGIHVVQSMTRTNGARRAGRVQRAGVLGLLEQNHVFDRVIAMTNRRGCTGREREHSASTEIS